MRLKVLTWPLLALLALAPLAARPAAGAEMSFPQFERCLKENGLAAAAAQQAGPPVQVCKTFKVTRVTVYAWGLTIDPAAASVQIPLQQTVRVGYRLATTAAPTVSWIVDGLVVVRNVGPTDATISAVRDVLTLPDGTEMAQTLGSGPFTLQSPQAKDCIAPPERVLRYRFSVPGPAVPALPAAGANEATVTWSAAGGPARTMAATGADSAVAPGTSAARIDVLFSEGPDLNEVVYFRNASLTPGLDPGPPGLSVGPTDNPGPFPLAADQPPTLVRSLTVAIGNQALACASSATVTGVGVVQSPSVPELVGDPSLPALPPLPVNVSSRSLLLVGSPPCAAAAERGPGVTGAGAAASAGSAPAKPRPPRTPACPRPRLAASLSGPSRTLANGRASWLITVRNLGGAAARRVVLRQRVPAGFAFVGASRAVSSAGRLLTFSAARLPAGSKLAIRLRLQAGAVPASGHQRLRVSAQCGAVAQARAPARVTPAIRPAVTG